MILSAGLFHREEAVLTFLWKNPVNILWIFRDLKTRSECGLGCIDTELHQARKAVAVACNCSGILIRDSEISVDCKQEGAGCNYIVWCWNYVALFLNVGTKFLMPWRQFFHKPWKTFLIKNKQTKNLQNQNTKRKKKKNQLFAWLYNNQLKFVGVMRVFFFSVDLTLVGEQIFGLINHEGVLATVTSSCDKAYLWGGLMNEFTDRTGSIISPRDLLIYSIMSSWLLLWYYITVVMVLLFKWDQLLCS